MKSLSRLPLYLFLLPLFFILHGWVENLGIVYADDVARLAGWYLFVAGALFGLSWLVFRDLHKAAFFAFGLLAFNFFFGAMHDGLKKIEAIPFISRYVFVLPLSILLLVIFFIRMRRSRKDFSGAAAFLNLLFVVLILIDAFNLFRALGKEDAGDKSPVLALAPCTGCPRPDVYLIITDGYPSNIQLREKLAYDNSPFIQKLRQRGFFVADSSVSNYNMTPVSVASLLDMQYLDAVEGTNATYKKDVAMALTRIRNSRFPEYLRSLGYEVRNHSIFDLNKEPSYTEPTFLPKRTSNITAQTFTRRVITDLGFHLIDKFNIGFIVRKSKYADLRNNHRVYERTISSAKKAEEPQFVYSHLMMPHYPYYYDSTGRQRELVELTTELHTDTAAFVSYLKYANGRFLTMIDQLLANKSRNSIIILVGDHGFRNFRHKRDRDYYFMNLLAVRYPHQDSGTLYHTMSNVNLLRVILNDQFGQRLPLLEDRTRFLLE